VAWPSRVGLIVAILVAIVPGRAKAQLSGEHQLIAFGLKSGSQVPPGAFLVPTFLDWDVDWIKDRDGTEIPIGGLAVRSLALLTWVVTPKKVLGGNYGFLLVVPLVSSELEFPRLGLQTGSGLGLADIYVQPINLGWHTQRADYMAGLAFYAPTGSYEPNGRDNKGLGMWSFELSAGATLYIDPKKQWHFSALGFYEIHTNKQDQDLKVGNIMSVEGGLGGTFLKGDLNVGVAYGAQWKITDDGGADFPSTLLPGRNHIYTVGPEATFTGFYKPPWIASLTARYLWDVGAVSSFEGKRLIIFLTLGRLHVAPGGTAAPSE
jgi:hypothetical protein